MNECWHRRMAVVLAFALAACGASVAGSGSASSGVDAGADAGAGASSGKGIGDGQPGAVAWGSGSQTSGSSGAASGATSSTDASAADANTGLVPEGGSHPSRGCGLGTSCTPGSDLAAPVAAAGFQIGTPPGMFTVQPGQELLPTYCQVSPNTAQFDVGTIQGWMTPGSSHELMVYQTAGGAMAGTSSSCNPGAGKWMYASSISGEVVELKMPDGVGISLQPQTPIMLVLHFVNVGSSVETPQVKVNFLSSPDVQYQAGAMLSFNTAISIPAATASGPGTQTVTGRCTAPAGSHFFAIGTHTNGHATTADVDFVSNGTIVNIVHTTDWQRPDVGVWDAPGFLTIQSGDAFDYRCAYSNSSAMVIPVGDTSSNDVCMMVAYYFPAGSTACN